MYIYIPSGNQKWQWKMDHLQVTHLLKPPFSSDIFQLAMCNFQKLNPIKSYKPIIFLWFSYGSQKVFGL